MHSDGIPPWLRPPPHRAPLKSSNRRASTGDGPRIRPGRSPCSARFAATDCWKRWRSPPRNCCAPPICRSHCRKSSSKCGQATGVDRGHIFLIDTASGQGNILQHSVWTAPGIATPPEFKHATEPLANVGLKSWISRFERGETIVGHVCDFDPEKRAFFDLGGVKSVLVVPVFSDGQWLGVIGFDDCHSERDWSAAEIDAINTVAELVGAGDSPDGATKTVGRRQSHHREQSDDPVPPEPAEPLPLDLPLTERAAIRLRRR